MTPMFSFRSLSLFAHFAAALAVFVSCTTEVPVEVSAGEIIVETPRPGVQLSDTPAGGPPTTVQFTTISTGADDACGLRRDGSAVC